MFQIVFFILTIYVLLTWFSTTASMLRIWRDFKKYNCLQISVNKVFVYVSDKRNQPYCTFPSHVQKLSFFYGRHLVLIIQITFSLMDDLAESTFCGA